jgi:hypothetical protein
MLRADPRLRKSTMLTREPYRAKDLTDIVEPM